jgi:hypothetical protein
MRKKNYALSMMREEKDGKSIWFTDSKEVL